MKLLKRSKPTALSLLLMLLAWLAFATNGYGNLVTENEAIAAADLWYAMEINSEHCKLDAAEKAQRIANIDQREVLYYMDDNTLSAAPPAKGKRPVLGYIVKYQPRGYVVVSGEDRFEPFLAFDADSPFVWDLPQGAFMQDFLDYSLLGRWQIVRNEIKAKKGISFDNVHAGWTKVRSKLKEYNDLANVTHTQGSGQGAKGQKSIYVLWDTALWDQGEYYNQTVLDVHNNQWPGIVTGCVATAHAIKARYHEWPPNGWGEQAYFDTQGDVQWFHQVDFYVQTYDWDSMSTGNIGYHDADIADLMYHCGVVSHMNYEEGSSSAITENAAERFEVHFRYHGGFWAELIYEPFLSESIRGGCPVVANGPRKNDPDKRHAWLITGYRDDEDPHFYMNLGWGGSSNGWYNLVDITPDRLYYVDGAEPYSHPNSWKYVASDASFPGAGLLRDPYLWLTTGYNAVPEGGQLWIKAGTYDDTLTFDKEMEINAYKGEVTIG